MLPFPMTLNDLERLSKISHNTEPRGLDLSATDRLVVILSCSFNQREPRIIKFSSARVDFVLVFVPV